MVKNTVVQQLKGKKQDVSGDESLLHFSLKALCYAGFFPYEKICNTPRKLQLYRAYQIAVYVLHCPTLFSHTVKLYLISEDLQLAIETVTHIWINVASCFILSFINWNDVYKLICKLDRSMQSKRLSHHDRKTTEILRETHQKCKFVSLFVTILGLVGLLVDLCDIFILHFVENIVGVEHKYKMNPNAANIYESLLLEKYPFSCWTPFDERSVTAHVAVYIYTAFNYLMVALRAGSTISVLLGTLRYTSLKFKFVCKSLEELSNMEDSDRLREQNTSSNPEKQNTSSTSEKQNTSITSEKQNTSSTPENQHKCEEFNNTNIQVSSIDGELFHTPSQAQPTECTNKPKNTGTSITAVHCANDQRHKADSDRLPSDNKSSPEECVLTIIKNHQEAIW
jgi:hypothetical protein